MEHLYVPVTGFCMERSRVDSAGEMAYFHYHNAYEIYFLVSGTRNYIINDKLFSLQEGDVVLVPPQALHKTTGCGYERILISFDRSYLEQNFVPDKADLLLKGFAPQTEWCRLNCCLKGYGMNKKNRITASASSIWENCWPLCKPAPPIRNRPAKYLISWNTSTRTTGRSKESTRLHSGFICRVTISAGFSSSIPACRSWNISIISRSKTPVYRLLQIGAV